MNLRKITIKERQQQIWENKKQRRARAKKLLRLGLALEVTQLFIYSQEIILGHLFQFKKVVPMDQEKFKLYGEEILKEIDRHDEEVISDLTKEEKKARNHRLITYGALFEIAGVTEVNLAVMLGYLDRLHGKENNYRNFCYQEGKIYFLKNEKK
ncbi:conjugal transfer protein TraD [Fusobacterium ulcerans]|uniref:conjugal transfer protein TraD n=1 Tax=Fusobacterium ulcerans TaxID=861 RepID=UPI002E792683|nr:conjugal transfer protein TraD [Fusobacterium ulcerans]MEE0137723.1 conjugal transfer protein TraD [Fusobacterium ulcerans]